MSIQFNAKNGLYNYFIQGDQHRDKSRYLVNKGLALFSSDNHDTILWRIYY